MGYRFQLAGNDSVNLQFSRVQFCTYMQKKVKRDSATRSTKSIISYPFLKHFHRNNNIYKITTPSNGVKEKICRRMPRNLFSSNPIPAKAKKLGLLSMYKFSLYWSMECFLWKVELSNLIHCKINKETPYRTVFSFQNNKFWKITA